MIALLQRVGRASVAIDGAVVGAIDRGILVFVGVQRRDGEAQAQRLAERVLGYRVFADEQGRMNRSVADIGGGVLLVPQFTLAADTSTGMRASFSSAAPPEEGRRLFDRMVDEVRSRCTTVATGAFGADMQVALVNDGPVTFWLQAD
ncbi:MAG: D-tyrosyl-tRNA(Tyr) deacylase [Burkholderiales bacterium]|nr:D-tyrosyl-tRNA(Tyr) deacylase [Burkholderiales bacterium]